jgi:hypothetical protein
MGLKDKLRRISRMAEREMITFELEDGTTARFYEGEIFPECFLHETGRWRRNYFGEDPGPAHPFVEALRKSKEGEPERLAQTQGTMVLLLLGEDMIIRGEKERIGSPVRETSPGVYE